MQAFFDFFNKINLVLWISVIFVLHGFLYYALGTSNWFSVTLLATATYAVVLATLKGVSARRRNKTSS